METLRQVSPLLVCKKPLYFTRAPRVSDNSSFDFYSRMLWGLGSQAQVLKVEVPDVGYRSFALRGEMPGFEFPQDCGSEHYSAVSRKISSSPASSVWFPFHLRDVKRSLYQFLRFFRGNFTYIAVNSVSLEGDEFCIFLCRCLESLFFFNFESFILKITLKTNLKII